MLLRYELDSQPDRLAYKNNTANKTLKHHQTPFLGEDGVCRASCSLLPIKQCMLIVAH